MELKYLFYILSLLFLFELSGAQDSIQNRKDIIWSKRIADSFLDRHPDAVTYDSGAPSQKWNYEQGLMLHALNEMWKHSGEKKYFEFIQKNLDLYIGDSGNIKTYKMSDYNLDNIGPGRAMLAVYQETKQQKYRAAADSLYMQLKNQPRTNEGGFWHKKIYPYQMWLDGLFMAEPFYSRYAVLSGQSGQFDDITNQFIWITKHTKDDQTQLLYHAWDESKIQKWANPQTGKSPSFWGRAMGWYAMALVDVLDIIPVSHPKRKDLVKMFQDFSETILKYRDAKSLLWYQVIDQPDKSGNYLEASASCMFAYCFAKGANKGLLDKKFFTAAEQTFQKITGTFVSYDSKGMIDLHGTCRGVGLGGNPYRDGSYQYYISETQRTNDMKGIGPFLLTAIEIENGEKLSHNDPK
jgi:unsaturated rhamnogalacturonyl hydrolase